MDASLGAMTAARRAAKTQSLAIPWFVYAALFGSTSIIIGGEWDISWHQSIGRDTFWSPPHLAIYLGGVVAGLASAWVVLRTTFKGSAQERAEGVRLWGFTGPLGAFFCIWGALAMVTSAPFDDWWHNAYGLDTEILSPPHVVLAVGIGVIQLGAIVTTLALQNRNEQEAEAGDVAAIRRRTLLRLMYVYAAGMLLKSAFVMAWSYMNRVLMHSSIFYQVGCLVLPLFIIPAARASRLRWPATATAAVYMGLSLALVWVLPLFPAEPKLGPVRQHVTHLIPLEFPLLLVFPAFAIDLVMRRMGERRDWLLSLALGLAFFAALLAVQWPFGDFLMSPLSRNRVFATDQFGYYVSPDWHTFRHVFYPWDGGRAALVVGLLAAIPLGVMSARIALWWGNWMKGVRR
ncbi:MAG TPA: hypothetical protein VNI02_19200 [Blastocatellia bacterium]|jgi:hypothetical protein|nr:hypothetical protein [Blastocatellia bacterium]